MTGVPGVRIEPMRWWQIDQCAAVDQQVFETTAWSRESFWGELARVPESRFYVVALEGTETAERDAQVVGYAGLAAIPPEADVQTVAVAPNAQGLGLGRALLDELLAEAGRRGCATVLLEVAADNEAAIGLYTARGFEQISRRSGYYGPGRDALIMRWREPVAGRGSGG